VALFASNLIRLQVLIDQLAKLGRRVALQGRSMNRNVELGQKAGVLRVPEGLLCSMEQAASLPPEKVAILSTGAQAEPRSGPFQMLSKDGPGPKLAPGDTVIVSARAIPGNERAVAAMLDALYLRGANVIHAQLEPSIHASGHASRPQQRRMIEAVRPRHFLPVHGEARHLFQHAQLARETGVEPDRVLLGYDGDVVAFSEGRGSVTGAVAAGRLLLDRWGGGSVAPDAIEERLTLADGILFAVVAVQAGTGRIVGGPELTGRGLASEELALLTLVQEEIRAALEATSPQLRGDVAFLRETLRAAVRKSFKQRTGKRPVVVPHVLKL
jgi:ribonuclease J